MTDDINRRIAEKPKLGGVASADWQSYTWKNELAEQKRRILQHLNEALADADTPHNPYHMLESAIGVASVCMRRLIECHLVTDKFRGSQIDVHEIHVRADTKWREPFLSSTAGGTFNNYDMTVRHTIRRAPKYISNKMLHARFIGVLSGSSYLPDGLLIASDDQRRISAFHFTTLEIGDLFDAFLDDQVNLMVDGYLDPANPGKIVAIRD
ncbi:hypothetical protein EET67_20660 [Pseudaminobacter arsenicus]|uniref:Uncharacterized protein n=1 Tax=Borborobacter arsenicus TaxID=1851146 RepID=A0A432V144_9HYPH|nr:hypothetical protein [Pseudaminobacter arsenicus]RUM95934.1 hypothetical protein EET67_20660 [Pseudaminobacter arsenicus]